jgi:hypothetical protein
VAITGSPHDIASSSESGEDIESGIEGPYWFDLPNEVHAVLHSKCASEKLQRSSVGSFARDREVNVEPQLAVHDCGDRLH